MDIRPFLSRFARWWGTVSADISSPLVDNPEQAYQREAEKNLVRRGRMLLRKIEFLRNESQRFQAEEHELAQELRDLENHPEHIVQLESGERLVFDLSRGERWSAFWTEAQSLLRGDLTSRKKALPLPTDAHQLSPVQEAKQKVSSLFQQVKEQGSDRDSFPQLYNRAFLDQESDELLHYL